jgi:hypothetical protein
MFAFTNLLNCLVYVYLFIAEMKRLTFLAIVHHSDLHGITPPDRIWILQTY